MLAAEALRIPDAQQVTIFLSFGNLPSWLLRLPKGILVLPFTWPPANSPGDRTSKIKAFERSIGSCFLIPKRERSVLIIGQVWLGQFGLGKLLDGCR